jgi:hypothetical protein
MEPDTPAPPPEAILIRTAREAAGMTAAQAAHASEGAVSATYWRDVERGYGGRRGQQAAARASARLLAVMARITGVTPRQLAGAEREDAARVLTEILRREDAASAPPLHAAPDAPPGAVTSPAEDILDGLLASYPDDPVVASLATQKRKAARVIVAEILEWLDFLADRDGLPENGASAG